MNKHIPLLICFFVLAGCFEPIKPVTSPTPLPIVIPSLPILATPSPIQTPSVNVNSIIGNEIFKLEFYPGSKGVISFTPTSKGLEFYPGSKGLEFYPGSKGLEFYPGSKGLEFYPGSKGLQNVRFNINLSDKLVRNDIPNFEVKNTNLLLDNIVITLEKDDKVIATTTLLPKTSNFVFGIDFISSEIKDNLNEYKVKVLANNNFKAIQETSLVKLENDTEVKITLYSETLKPEDLDIAIRTKSLK